MNKYAQLTLQGCYCHLFFFYLSQTLFSFILGWLRTQIVNYFNSFVLLVFNNCYFYLLSFFCLMLLIVVEVYVSCNLCIPYENVIFDQFHNFLIFYWNYLIHLLLFNFLNNKVNSLCYLWQIWNHFLFYLCF